MQCNAITSRKFAVSNESHQLCATQHKESKSVQHFPLLSASVTQAAYQVCIVYLRTQCLEEVTVVIKL